jgi:DNA-binding transcriptional MerR regulator/effector-binding domain-containing protein
VYKIGEFSKITNLTIKTLRYYDEEGILHPSSYLDNGYRIYNEEDYYKAQRIVLLRDLDFSIREIKDVLRNVSTEEELQYFFKEKQEMIIEKIKSQKALVKKINTFLSPNQNQENTNRSYTMLVKEIESIQVASIRFIGQYTEMGTYIGKLYKYLKSNSTGIPFACYYDGEYKEEADIEICIPIKKYMKSTNEISIKTLPPIKALTTVHIGTYDSLHYAYKAILDYAKDTTLELYFPSREEYHKGPGMVLKGNPSKYVTEIMIPIVE